MKQSELDWRSRQLEPAHWTVPVASAILYGYLESEAMCSCSGNLPKVDFCVDFTYHGGWSTVAASVNDVFRIADYGSGVFRVVAILRLRRFRSEAIWGRLIRDTLLQPDPLNHTSGLNQFVLEFGKGSNVLVVWYLAKSSILCCMSHAAMVAFIFDWRTMDLAFFALFWCKTQPYYAVKAYILLSLC